MRPLTDKKLNAHPVERALLDLLAKYRHEFGALLAKHHQNRRLDTGVTAEDLVVDHVSTFEDDNVRDPNAGVVVGTRAGSIYLRVHTRPPLHPDH